MQSIPYWFTEDAGELPSPSMRLHTVVQTKPAIVRVLMKAILP